ncbi:DUF4129 domain-containing protein [Subsaxibacter sp. CAU 1640]|uniref:DUF4129 domain-containing protein n=1 Tax=Subsaxibacter sp. CAU 1640 TaxID=2933271 RepID=UPI0020052A7C|nr:DUF4129 domain-containing protein [Subsaxibacter sp. CAU 1640]MCK7591584.1 DUF4129 domain-containing protein [Subsaxibacter sp. CAU 1640]
MNKKLWIYCLIICLGVSVNGFAVSTVSTEMAQQQTLIDSIPSDDTSIEPREYDNLKDKYKGDEFVYERNVENAGWWTRFKQWLNDLFRDLFNLNSAGQASRATDIALKIGGVIIFLLVIYFIFKAVMNDEGKWIFGKSSDKSIIPVTDVETNIHSTDFKKLTANAEKDGNYRLAIRYYYLWLLKGLTNAEIIEYDVEKTNSDYYNEIVSKQIKDEFSYTSYLYNYIWYGEFDVNEQQFDKAKTAFTKFLKSIKA